MLVRSRKQTPVFIVIPFHTTSGSSRVQSRTILAPSWNWHSALGFSLGLSRTTLAPPWSWHSALGFGFAVESDNASPILELAFGTRSSISRLYPEKRGYECFYIQGAPLNHYTGTCAPGLTVESSGRTSKVQSQDPLARKSPSYSTELLEPWSRTGKDAEEFVQLRYLLRLLHAAILLGPNDVPATACNVIVFQGLAAMRASSTPDF
ncbi:hypothetical protein B0H17DRAFT_1185806 [Mycena rosella]|uniref:Uncharacterized protein n=1 Tax=Mycena rosella TaxID=1033263 RepID=A0AAD7CPW0_MYCRO|nr:hypothetical protein B0H17DRAFT_1185806 [Mycena rosella]